MHYVDKPNSITAEGVTIGREKGVAFGCELTIHAKVQHLEVSAFALHPVSDLQQVLRRAGEAIQLADEQCVALADEIESRF